MYMLLLVTCARYVIVEPPDRLYGAPNPDGSWNGMVGMVKRGVRMLDYSYSLFHSLLKVACKVDEWYM